MHPHGGGAGRPRPGYGFFTVMLVPSLSPSGSWFAVESYEYEAWLTELTLSVAEVFFAFMVPDETLHWPEALVMQEPPPE